MNAAPQSLIRADALNELVETARIAPPGDLVEVGVYRGGSAVALARVAREQKRRLYLFDTFTGIPCANPSVDEHKVGDFGDCSMDDVRAAIPEATIIVGVFPGTLKHVPELGPIALAHIDCDQYSSVRACCDWLDSKMAPGGVMVFDDYDCLPGAKKAVEEMFPGRARISAQGKARVTF
jgi:predicted O-methyltransferase YrrM